MNDKEIIQDILSNLEIKKAIVIDDELAKVDEKSFDISLELISIKGEELKELFKDDSTPDILEDIFEYKNFDELYNDEELKMTVVKKLKAQNPEFFGTNIDHIIKQLTEILNIEIELFGSPDELSATTLSNTDLILMDYDFDGRFNALEKISGLELDEKKIYYIVLMSSRETFDYDKSYDMMNPEKRQELFRKYSHEKSLEFKALLNYINKANFSEPTDMVKSLSHILIELKAGKLMTDVLTSVKELVYDGLNESLKTLFLTNSKTLKLLISNKLENEGVSETTYLVDLTLSLIKNLINAKYDKMPLIHDTLAKIKDFEYEIWDYETDNHLKQISKIQLEDRHVNHRYSPIEFGDIFKVFTTKTEFRYGLLISQSCDLVIRENNKEIGRKDKVATLILSVDKNDGQSSHRMNLLDSKIIWDVRHVYTIPSEILDFTSLNTNGYSQIEKDISIERKFSWGSYYTTYMENLTNRFLKKYEGTAIGSSVHWDNGIGYPVEILDDKIKFNIERMARLEVGHTNSILKLYTDIKNRVPIMLDPSDSPLEFSPPFKLNNRKNKRQPFNLFVQKNQHNGKETYYIHVNAYINELKKLDYGVPNDYHSFLEKKFDIKSFKISEVLESRLLHLTLDNVKKLEGFGIFVDIEAKNINCIFCKNIILNNETLKIEENYHISANESSNPMILVNQEKLEFLETQLEDHLINDMHINLLENVFSPKLEFDGNKITFTFNVESLQESN